MNFWQPSAHGFNAPPGTPFFFRLKAPHHAIGGFGIFARYEPATVRLAWEAFGEKNGAPSFDAMSHRVGRYARATGGPAHRIGCIMVATPVFFAPGEWVEQPRDWRPNIVSGAGYDLREGEGRRIWEECLARAAKAQPVPLVANGLLLRADIHRLFDAGYVTVTPEHQFVVSQRLAREWENGKVYYEMDGREIALPKRVADRPDPELLRWHNDNVFERAAA